MDGRWHRQLKVPENKTKANLLDVFFELTVVMLNSFIQIQLQVATNWHAFEITIWSREVLSSRVVTFHIYRHASRLVITARRREQISPTYRFSSSHLQAFTVHTYFEQCGQNPRVPQRYFLTQVTQSSALVVIPRWTLTGGGLSLLHGLSSNCSEHGRWKSLFGSERGHKGSPEKRGYKNADGGCFSFEMEPES